MEQKELKIPKEIKTYCQKMKMVFNGLNYYKNHLIKYRDAGGTLHNFVIKDRIIKHSLHYIGKESYGNKDDEYKMVPLFPKGALDGVEIEK